MFKHRQHTLFCLLVGLWAGCLSFSCKSGKTTQAKPPVKEISKVNMEAVFGAKYVDGCAARMKGNLQDALKLFNDCQKIDPSNAAVRYELGTIYKLLGVNELALANAKSCAEADPKNEWYQLLLVECFNGIKQYHQAVKVRETLVKNFPTNTEFQEDLAIEYAMAGQYDKAFELYDGLEKIYGVNEQITLNKVKLLKEQKRSRAAETELLKLSASNKNETRYYSYLADFYMETGDLEKAKQMYDRILAINPNDPIVNLALHDYYASQGKNEEAFVYLRKAFENPDLDLKTKSDIVTSFYKRSAEAHDPQAKEQGMELVKMLLTMYPSSASVNLTYADFLMLDNKQSEALNHYYQAAVDNKRDYLTWSKLLSIEYNKAKYDSLERHSARAMELFPSQPANYLYNGIANMQLKNYKKAVASLKDGLEFVVDNKALLLDFYKSLGDANYYLEDFARSDKAFEEALKIDSDNTYVLNNYAYYLSLRNENLDKAEKLSRRTIELRPNDRNYMDTYGWILFQQQKYKEAEEWLSNAAKGEPKNPNILEHYGDLLYRLNKKEQALTLWEQAKQAGGNSETLLKKIKDKKLND